MAEAWNHRGAVGELFCPPTGRPRRLGGSHQRHSGQNAAAFASMFGTTLLGRLSHRLLWTKHAALPRTKPLLQLSKIAQWSGHLQQGRLSSHLGSGSLLLRASGCASIATPWRTAPRCMVMPEVIGNKRAGPALRDGTVLCPQWNQGLCINGDACPVAHRCAAVCRSGRVCGGHHPALKCRSPEGAVGECPHYTKPPARKRGGAAEGVTAGRGPEPEEARPSHRKPAAEASSSHRGLAAADEEFVDVLVRERRAGACADDASPPVPGCCPWRRRGLGDRRGQLSLCPWTPKLKPTCPRLALRCSTAWLGAGQLRGQPLCLERNPDPHPLRPTCAGTAPPLWAGGLAGLSFGPGTRSQEWSDSARCAAAHCLLEKF